MSKVTKKNLSRWLRCLNEYGDLVVHVEPKPMPEAKAESKPENKPEAKTESKAESKAENKPEAKAEGKPEAEKSKLKAKTKITVTFKTMWRGCGSNYIEYPQQSNSPLRWGLFYRITPPRSSPCAPNTVIKPCGYVGDSNTGRIGSS
jgi:hypothetical protein